MDVVGVDALRFILQVLKWYQARDIPVTPVHPVSNILDYKTLMFQFPFILLVFE